MEEGVDEGEGEPKKEYAKDDQDERDRERERETRTMTRTMARTPRSRTRTLRSNQLVEENHLTARAQKTQDQKAPAAPRDLSQRRRSNPKLLTSHPARGLRPKRRRSKTPSQRPKHLSPRKPRPRRRK